MTGAASRDHSPSEATPRLPLFVAVATVVLAFIRFGYHYGTGDQDELIPSVMNLLDGSLYPRDWIVQTVTDGVTVRSYFLWLITGPSLVLPVWLVTLALWVMVGIGVAYGVHAIAWELLRDRLAAAVAVPLALAVTVRFTIGGNALHYAALAPEGVAWAIALPGIALFLRGRMAPAGVLLGVAAWFHLLAGLHPAMLLGLALAWHVLRRRRRPAELFWFGGAFAVAAIPILVPVAWDHLVGATADPAGVSPLYVHAFFRNPHHHLITQTPAGLVARFAVTVAVGLAAAFWLVRRGRLYHAPLLAAAGIAAVGFIVLGAVGVEAVGMATTAKLQFPKLTVLITLVMSIAASGALVALLPPRWRQRGERELARRGVWLAAALILAAAVTALSVGDVALGERAYPVRHQESALGEVEAWARAGTPVDALFATPPSVSSFRSFARRSVVANYTAFVFTDEAMQEWFDRLMRVAPIEPPARGFGVTAALDAAYHDRSREEWLELAERYGLDYAVVERAADASGLPAAFENDGWRVLVLRSDTSGP
jgi:hypothetical protein